MLIPLPTIIKKYRPQIKGIIHVGAHHAQEHDDYQRAGIHKIVYIEASPKTYAHLSQKRFGPDVRLFNVACADYEGYADMYCERNNQGQSSSLLAPGTHTKHYPDIVFNEREKVKVVKLDSLLLNGYNFMNIDVQGAEMMVLRGATTTLVNIDWVYIEVNRENVYEGCAHVEEIDLFLSDFERVETQWTGQGWGDALYRRVKAATQFEATVKWSEV